MTDRQEFLETKVGYGIVFSSNLGEIEGLKEGILRVIESLPHSKVVFQKIAAGHLRIVAEEGPR